MKRAIQARILLTCIVVIVLRPSLLVGQDATIIVRLVNGKNGKPITDENLNVFINNGGDARLFRADRDGIIKLTTARSDVLSFVSNIEVTCHPYDKEEHELRKYRVSDILEHGIADQNKCSTAIRVKANPGEFVFYERPRTFLEWMRL